MPRECPSRATWAHVKYRCSPSKARNVAKDFQKHVLIVPDSKAAAVDVIFQLGDLKQTEIQK